ncbi:unnamed protein product [Paramecium primaurelia]|uniref:Uncharacterized protein n=1 Tax=Paramecium primaurelia TaxID=5886 RepID=A0A8S1K5F0_PARPR|nr:unnamed protein product [Paramecium primaurelia]
MHLRLNYMTALLQLLIDEYSQLFIVQHPFPPDQRIQERLQIQQTSLLLLSQIDSHRSDGTTQHQDLKKQHLQFNYIGLNSHPIPQVPLVQIFNWHSLNFLKFKHSPQFKQLNFRYKLHLYIFDLLNPIYKVIKIMLSHIIIQVHNHNNLKEANNNQQCYLQYTQKGSFHNLDVLNLHIFSINNHYHQTHQNIVVQHHSNNNIHLTNLFCSFFALYIQSSLPSLIHILLDQRKKQQYIQDSMLNILNVMMYNQQIQVYSCTLQKWNYICNNLTRSI